MKIDSWRLRGVVGALSLIIVGGFLGILIRGKRDGRGAPGVAPAYDRKLS
jgi:hypothetical protein